LVLAALGAAVLVRWRCLSDPAIPFLTHKPPAEWILLPTTWRSKREVEDRRVRFRRSFELPVRPASGHVEIRAFQEYVLWVNGVEVGSGPGRGVSWKSVRKHDVHSVLSGGVNRVEVEVANPSGPPVLWLVLRTDDGTLIKTDTQWECRSGDDAWRPAGLATEPMQVVLSQTPPTVPEAWRRAGWVLLLWLGIAVVAIVMGGWVSRRVAANRATGSEGTTDPLPPDRWERGLVGLAVAAYLVLGLNNLCRLPPVIGFDGPEHLSYVRFLIEELRLPLASDGFQMYQPPLFYVVSAVLATLGLSGGWSDALTTAPKLVNMFAGVAQILLVWSVLGLMFPESRRARYAGLILAAAMPMNLYMGQYLSNEVTCAALVTASLVIALRILRDDPTSWRRYAGLGGALGLAMLAKHTAFLAVVVVLAVVTVHVAVRHRREWPAVAGRIGAMLIALVLVAGWNAARNWIHFRDPLVGNWNPATGHWWWQDPGYRTAESFLRFGRSLKEPYRSGVYSYADGIYSTVWGDGLLGGTQPWPPWNYNLMTAGYALAIYPTVLVLLGFVAALVGWVRRPTAAWSLLGGHGVLVGFAVFYMALKLPYAGQAKGFYGLSAMAFGCVIGALGFDRMYRRLGRIGGALWVPLLAWGINAWASFFVLPLSAREYEQLGYLLVGQGKIDRGIAYYTKALRLDPNLPEAHCHLASALTRQGKTEQAIVHSMQAIRLRPDLARAHFNLGAALDRQGKLDEAVRCYREALRLVPPYPEAHNNLGLALVRQGKPQEAIAHYEKALGLAPDWPEPFGNLARLLATHPSANLRDATRAVQLAQWACKLTRYEDPEFLTVLAAAYAEARRFPDAVQTAQRGIALAIRRGQRDRVKRLQEHLHLYQQGRPVRETASESPDPRTASPTGL